MSNCKKLLQEIVNMPNAEKFLGTFGESKTIFYDFTPDLIKEALNKKSLQNTMGLTLQEVGKGTVKTAPFFSFIIQFLHRFEYHSRLSAL